jgi:hypothetical protein
MSCRFSLVTVEDDSSLYGEQELDSLAGQADFLFFDSRKDENLEVHARCAELAKTIKKVCIEDKFSNCLRLVFPETYLSENAVKYFTSFIIASGIDYELEEILIYTHSSLVLYTFQEEIGRGTISSKDVVLEVKHGVGSGSFKDVDIMDYYPDYD